MNSNKSKTSCKQGFTLIELLVVVLIIGILAAVAVPQYRKAVAKARYAESKSLAESIYRAQQVYHLANGTYTIRFADLDMDIPSYKSGGSSARFFKGDNHCALDTTYVVCKSMDINMAYRIDYATGKRHCIAYGDDEAAFDHRICKDETSDGRPEGYFHTYWYP